VAYFSALKTQAPCSSEITTWSRVLLEKLTVPQILKKFPTLYGTRRFTVTFTTTYLLSLF
jgi:hypothetical protein